MPAGSFSFRILLGPAGLKHTSGKGEPRQNTQGEIEMEKRNKPIAGVGTERHKEAIKTIASFDKAFPPSESQIVCAAVLFTEASLRNGSLTMETLFSKYHQAVHG
jgi:hypothetical protein